MQILYHIYMNTLLYIYIFLTQQYRMIKKELNGFKIAFFRNLMTCEHLICPWGYIKNLCLDCFFLTALSK